MSVSSSSRLPPEFNQASASSTSSSQSSNSYAAAFQQCLNELSNCGQYRDTMQSLTGQTKPIGALSELGLSKRFMPLTKAYRRWSGKRPWVENASDVLKQIELQGSHDPITRTLNTRLNHLNKSLATVSAKMQRGAKAADFPQLIGEHRQVGDLLFFKLLQQFHGSQILFHMRGASLNLGKGQKDSGLQSAHHTMIPALTVVTGRDLQWKLVDMVEEFRREKDEKGQQFDPRLTRLAHSFTRLFHGLPDIKACREIVESGASSQDAADLIFKSIEKVYPWLCADKPLAARLQHRLTDQIHAMRNGGECDPTLILELISYDVPGSELQKLFVQCGATSADIDTSVSRFVNRHLKNLHPIDTRSPLHWYLQTTVALPAAVNEADSVIEQVLRKETCYKGYELLSGRMDHMMGILNAVSMGHISPTQGFTQYASLAESLYTEFDKHMRVQYLKPLETVVNGLDELDKMSTAINGRRNARGLSQRQRQQLEPYLKGLKASLEAVGQRLYDLNQDENLRKSWGGSALAHPYNLGSNFEPNYLDLKVVDQLADEVDDCIHKLNQGRPSLPDGNRRHGVQKLMRSQLDRFRAIHASFQEEKKATQQTAKALPTLSKDPDAAMTRILLGQHKLEGIDFKRHSVEAAQYKSLKKHLPTYAQELRALEDRLEKVASQFFGVDVNDESKLAPSLDALAQLTKGFVSGPPSTAEAVEKLSKAVSGAQQLWKRALTEIQKWAVREDQLHSLLADNSIWNAIAAHNLERNKLGHQANLASGRVAEVQQLINVSTPESRNQLYGILQQEQSLLAQFELDLGACKAEACKLVGLIEQQEPRLGAVLGELKSRIRLGQADIQASRAECCSLLKTLITEARDQHSQAKIRHIGRIRSGLKPEVERLQSLLRRSVVERQAIVRYLDEAHAESQLRNSKVRVWLPTHTKIDDLVAELPKKKQACSSSSSSK